MNEGVIQMAKKTKTNKNSDIKSITLYTIAREMYSLHEIIVKGTSNDYFENIRDVYGSEQDNKTKIIDNLYDILNATYWKYMNPMNPKYFIGFNIENYCTEEGKESLGYLMLVLYIISKNENSDNKYKDESEPFRNYICSNLYKNDPEFLHKLIHSFDKIIGETGFYNGFQYGVYLKYCQAKQYVSLINENFKYELQNQLANIHDKIICIDDLIQHNKSIKPHIENIIINNKTFQQNNFGKLYNNMFYNSSGIYCHLACSQYINMYLYILNRLFFKWFVSIVNSDKSINIEKLIKYLKNFKTTYMQPDKPINAFSDFYIFITLKSYRNNYEDTVNILKSFNRKLSTRKLNIIKSKISDYIKNSFEVIELNPWEIISPSYMVKIIKLWLSYIDENTNEPIYINTKHTKHTVKYTVNHLESADGYNINEIETLGSFINYLISFDVKQYYDIIDLNIAFNEMIINNIFYGNLRVINYFNYNLKTIFCRIFELYNYIIAYIDDYERCGQ